MESVSNGSYFVIGLDGRPHGPLTADDLRGWIADGRAGRHSRTRRESETSWQPLRDLPEFEDAWRRPVREEGEPGTPASSGAADFDALAGDHSTRPPVVNIATSFRRAWLLVSRHFLELSGWSVLAALILYAVLAIPRVGWLAGLVFNSILTGGLSFVFLARIRGRSVAIGDLWQALAATVTHLCLAGLAQAVITTAGLLLILPGVYLAVAYVFTLPLAIDKRLPFWMAMEVSRRAVHRQWWPTFGLLLVSVALLFSTVLTLGIGLVLAMPLCTAALMYAYEDVFGD